MDAIVTFSLFVVIESLLRVYPASLAGALLLNGAVCGLAFLIIWKLFRARLNHLKINIDKSLPKGQIVREIKNAVIVLATGAVFSSIVIVSSQFGLTKLYVDIDAYPLLWTFLSFPVLLFVNDTVFYWVHRTLHSPFFYHRIHREHHKSYIVNPMTSVSFHWLEPILLTVWILPVCLLLPVYAPVLGLVQIYGLLDNIKSHLGFELFPKWFLRSPLRFLTTATYHDLHHTKFRGNYGLHFRFWDKFCGTEISTYKEVFLDIKDRS